MNIDGPPGVSLEEADIILLSVDSKREESPMDVLPWKSTICVSEVNMDPNAVCPKAEEVWVLSLVVK